MSHWRFNPHPWPEVDLGVWDRLGGRDALALGIDARGFMSSQSVYRTTTMLSKGPVVIKVRQAVCTYRGQHGRKRRLRVVESHMTGTMTPSLVIIDIRPAYWTLEWLAWILDPNGDADPRRHRSSFYVGRLVEMSDERLLGQVEDVVGMRINPFGGFPQPDQIN